MKLGTFAVAVASNRDEEPMHVYNLYTQYGYGHGRHAEYAAIRFAMEAMRADVLEGCNLSAWGERDPKIGFPKIGAGLGGGDWDIIETIIDTVWHDFDVFVYSL